MILFMVEGKKEGALPGCAKDGNSKLDLEGPFENLFNKYVLQTGALLLGGGLMSGKGIFLVLQGNKMPVFPGTCMSLC